MGDDGALGMAELYRAGARTIAQNRETCAVFGMPSAAIALGAAEYILSLNQIATVMQELSKR
jgi:two-component system chemotaxis response regulator CheB